MQYNKVEISGVSTSELVVLTEKEKTELLKKAHAGDRYARETLIKAIDNFDTKLDVRFSTYAVPMV